MSLKRPFREVSLPLRPTLTSSRLKSPPPPNDVPHRTDARHPGTRLSPLGVGYTPVPRGVGRCHFGSKEANSSRLGEISRGTGRDVPGQDPPSSSGTEKPPECLLKGIYFSTRISPARGGAEGEPNPR